MDPKLKQWKLIDILDESDAHCQYCGTRIRWAFLIEYDGEQKIVGSECVRSHLDDADPRIALAFLDSEWHQRRQYYYKRVAGLTWVVGPRRDHTGWYLAATQSVRKFPWIFMRDKFKCPSEAMKYLALRLFKASWVGTKLREVTQIQEVGEDRNG